MDVITKSLKKSITYHQYRSLVKQLLEEGKSTSKNDSEDLVSYSKLNNSRMKRLDKTILLTEEVTKQISKFTDKTTWLVITEGWCGDAAQNLPIINKMAEQSQNIELRLVLRDENPELMNNFLTNGSQSIPILIQIKNGVVTHTWGPRPSIAKKMIVDYKSEHGIVDAEIKKKLQVWYNKDKGLNTIDDLLAILSVPSLEGTTT